MFAYPGADIPTIQSRINSILPPGANPKRLMFQVAGNDVVKQPAGRIIARYEALIRDIRKRYLKATIILSKIPPRKASAQTMAIINEINSHLDIFSHQLPDVNSVDVCPTALYHFKRDCTHFNTRGLNYYATNLARYLTNFLLTVLRPTM